MTPNIRRRSEAKVPQKNSSCLALKGCIFWSGDSQKNVFFNETVGFFDKNGPGVINLQMFGKSVDDGGLLLNWIRG